MKKYIDTDISTMNTFALPCVAQKLICFELVSEVVEFFHAASSEDEFLVLGGGSNLLLPEKLSTTVLRFMFDSVTYSRQSDGSVVVEVEAGKSWDQLVSETVERGLIGLENLSYIPGTVGAAPVQNIGAYGVELADLLVSVCVYDILEGEVCELENEQCQFAYRDSIFKHNPGRYYILSLKLRLSELADFKMDYGELKALHASDCVTVSQVRDKVIEVRKAKLPEPDVLPNAGSFFKNPIVPKDLSDTLNQKFSDLVSYDLDENNVKLAAGWLIDRAGWKGKRLGSVGVHSKQALVLVNHGGATQVDVLALAQKIQDSIFDLFSVRLEVEPKIIA